MKNLKSLAALQLVISELFISLLLYMSDHPHTSIGIESYRQDDDSKLVSRTESLKIIFFTLQKIYKYVLPSGNTTPLQNEPTTSCNKEDNPKTNKITKYIEAEIQQAKTQKNGITHMTMVHLLSIHQIIILPNRMSQV